MKKQNATIKKSIGNSYLIEVDGNFFSLVNWKKACKLLKIDNIHHELNQMLSNEHSENIQISIPKEKHKDELKGYDSIINWVDERRRVDNIINSFPIKSKLIKITAFKRIKPVGFQELENADIEYYLVFDKLELNVHKDVFMNQSGVIEIIEKRAF